jgi:hypothetical protein
MAVNPLRPVLAAATVLLMTPAIAHADGPDDQFLAMLSKDGIHGAPDQLIAIAHERCDAEGLSRTGGFNFRFGAQPSPFNIAMTKVYGDLGAQGVAPGYMAPFLRDAVAAYCPAG